ncbi:conserved protein of unknown function (plasmid) [Rhodovastum atsumiense]|uniref:DUF488 domain-containing protein n=1 Tax=Rhodovastum atsumiense TaxID=504468 RepID=A0A5M6ITM8_9PROT|nr:DUF488 domain-containing protein [Rhodovastum atsumiense]CAH2606305.1 conserved protein of unknown function [Rhodovastum atsumiense]
MEPREGTKVLTIGHSTLALDSFLNLLKKAGVTAVADVRSTPFSRRSPHFSRDEFRAALREIGIKYVFLGKELGGRPRASNLYCDGVADYEKMAVEPAFLKGIERIVKGSNEHTIALMCSEHNPLDCHRCLLVGRALAARKILLGHILSDGKTVTQYQIEEKLLALSGSENKDMFATREELLAAAYRSRARSVAYREPARELMAPAAPHWSDHAF